MYIGEQAIYKGKVCTICGIKNDKLIVEIQQPYSKGISKPQQIQVEEKELQLIDDLDEHFYIILEEGKPPVRFQNKQDLLTSITPSQINKAEVFEIKKLGKVKASIGQSSFLGKYL